MSTKEYAHSLRRQRGAATLIVVVVLMALLTLVVLTLTGLTTYELKTSSNMNRSKEALANAQAGLDYAAMKYLAAGSTFSETFSVPSGAADSVEVNVTVSTVSGAVEINSSSTSRDELASATVNEKYGKYSIFDFGDLPPLMAGGNFPPSGTFSIVAKPNGGGTGVPVSAWVKNSTTQGTASWQTCSYDEFLYDGTNDGASYSPETDGFVVCPTCKCQQASTTICEASNGFEPSSCPDVVADTCVPDTFETLFGDNVFDDSSISDGSGTACGSAGSVVPEEWKKYETDFGDLFSCADLPGLTGTEVKAKTAGASPNPDDPLPLVWIKGDCSIPANSTVGSYSSPFILVVHGDLTINSNSTVFGIVFAFSDIYSPGANEDNDITINGSPTVYGSILVNGNVDLPTGSFTLVYAEGILDDLGGGDGEGFEGLARFRGSWKDY